MGNEISSKKKRNRSVSFSSNILVTKLNSISEDYTLLNKKPLGVGISGKVILCQNKKDRKKYALKVLCFK